MVLKCTFHCVIGRSTYQGTLNDLTINWSWKKENSVFFNFGMMWEPNKDR